MHSEMGAERERETKFAAISWCAHFGTEIAKHSKQLNFRREDAESVELVKKKKKNMDKSIVFGEVGKREGVREKGRGIDCSEMEFQRQENRGGEFVDREGNTSNKTNNMF